MNNEILQLFNLCLKKINKLDIENKIDCINEIKILLHKNSPFVNEPVDCVIWKKNKEIKANDYNPNIVAPPEMELLKVSIENDGYTQPIVSWKNETFYEVIDGFHRNRVGKECKQIKKRIYGYLPITVINDNRSEKGDRIASTIRHNRARGKHTVLGMSDIILELKNRNWTNERIAKQLGMDEDEILRLCQITGLAKLFANQEFSKSWDIVDSEFNQNDKEPLSDDITIYDQSETENFRTVNTNDENRIFHHYSKWECYKAGFYNTTMEGMKREECEQAYCDFLKNNVKFEDALNHVINEWKYSCEHYLTNSALNRIAWLGQAAICYATGIPSTFRSGFNLLTQEEQKHANEIALKYLNKWLNNNNRQKITMEEAISTNQMDLY
ncbi:MAG: IbrB-like domain-containing protein [Candidatus Thorarchaeota archaeon]